MPDIMKLAKVIPMYTDMKMISRTTDPYHFSLHFPRVYSFLTQNEILCNNQYGFRRKHSTIDAITKFVTDATSSLDDKDTVLSVYMDRSKAFDTINHDILLRKLPFYSIWGKALDWFRSYLLNRKQSVCYSELSSKADTVKCGVSQVSVLGPLLFIMYTGWTGKDGSPSPTLGTIVKKSYNDSSVLSTSLGSNTLNNTSSLGLGGTKI